jgi:hypothetical protein
VGELVPGDAAEGAVGEVERLGRVEERRLHDASGKDDFVAWWVVVWGAMLAGHRMGRS